jgi:hypothetical protein
MNPQIELEIKNRIEADYKKIVENFGTNPFMTRPYISGTVINVTEDMVKKYGSQLKMGYHDFLNVVQPIAEKLLKQYFG